jgi:hypothetical protein
MRGAHPGYDHIEVFSTIDECGMPVFGDEVDCEEINPGGAPAAKALRLRPRVRQQVRRPGGGHARQVLLGCRAGTRMLSAPRAAVIVGWMLGQTEQKRSVGLVM